MTAWVADHRKHHAFSDKEGDPHSPHVGHEGGLRGALSGLFHAHMGWLFIHTHRGAKRALRTRPDQGPADPLGRPHLPPLGAGGAALSCVLGYAHRRNAHAGLDRAALGRRREDARGAPRDLQHQLALPLLRRAAVPHRRPLAQPSLAGAPDPRRVLAQQPPCVSHVGRHTACASGTSTPPPRSSACSSDSDSYGTLCASPPSARPRRPPARRTWRAPTSCDASSRRRCRTGRSARALGRDARARH